MKADRLRLVENDGGLFLFYVFCFLFNIFNFEFVFIDKIVTLKVYFIIISIN